MKDLTPGSVVGERYQVVRKIATGGMASVYEAEDLTKKRPVALKIPHSIFWHDRKGMKRFFREARATLNIRSLHVVRTYSVGKVRTTAMPFLVLEYVEGTPLRDLMYDERVQPKQLPQDLTLTILGQVASGVAAAHAVSVIHRDIKPDNVLITFQGDYPVAKVFDFGLSLLPPEVSISRLTEPNTTLGTPEYMAPEQAQSALHADARADVYSLGVLAYEMLAGALPFRGETPQDRWSNAWHGNAVDLRECRPELPTALVAEIMRAVSRDPKQRHADAHEFAQAIGPFVPTGAPDVVLGPARPTRPVPQDRWSWVLVVAGTFVAVLVLGLLVILLVRWFS